MLGCMPLPVSRRLSGVALPQSQHAFTLVELLLVVTIAAGLAAMALPSLGAMLATQRMVSLVNGFVASLHLARGEAIKRNGRVVLCKSPGGQACSAAGTWDRGWVVFHDVNNNAALDPGEPVIEQRQGGAPGLSLAGNAPVAHYVSYSASGSAKLVSGAFQAGTFTLCPAAAMPELQRQVILSRTGRPRVVKGGNGACP